ncbi:MAG: AraC family transcriptional regulator [Lentisphaeraceae bacterium]|nr:AraC family transcriptional regulator [Lentisphaeraceae bacterium]
MLYHHAVPNGPDSDLTMAHTNLKKERRGFLCDHYVMVLLVRGHGTYLEEDTGITHKMEQGNVYQRFPGRSHAQILDTDDNRQFFLRVPKHLFNLMKERGQINLNPVLTVNPVEAFKLYQNCLLDCQRENDGAFALWRLKDLIVELHAKSREAEEEPPIMHQAVDYMLKNINERTSLSIVAEKFNMSYINFRRQFKEFTGTSPGAWQIKQRVDKAKDMLSNDLLTIESISAYLGYPDIYTFSKQFKKETGLPPSDYRSSLIPRI